VSASKRPAPPQVAGPAENAATAPLTPQDSASLAYVLPMRPRWSQALIEGTDGPIPPYGSPAWSALPDDSRAKVASVVLAAEAWRTRHTRPDFYAPIPSRRAREIAEARRARSGDHPGGPVPLWELDEVASGE
jgi:hypothetical protein